MKQWQKLLIVPLTAGGGVLWRAGADGGGELLRADQISGESDRANQQDGGMEGVLHYAGRDNNRADSKLACG